MSDIGAGVAVRGISVSIPAPMAISWPGTCVMAGSSGLTGPEEKFSTPAIRGTRVVSPSTDGHIRCFDLRKGSLLWDHPTGKPIVASPVIRGRRVFTGSSEGVFRALGLKHGQLLWQFDSVKNFVETRPLIYQKGLFWLLGATTFYALHRKNGRLLWKREKYTNRMLSPAAVWPVAARGKIFIVAPDRRMTALDARTGDEIWDSGKWSCRIHRHFRR